MFRKIVVGWMVSVCLAAAANASLINAAADSLDRDPARDNLQVCEDPSCGVGPGGVLCAACQMFRGALASLPRDGIQRKGSIIEHGVILETIADDPETRELLWEIAVARNEILESVHRGQAVPLCAACRANVDAFSELQIIVQRIPMGVLQVYTSSSPEMVSLLQAMVLAEQESPL